jgi:hypothetical protein
VTAKRWHIEEPHDFQSVLEHPPSIYEVDLLDELPGQDRSKIKISKTLWRSPYYTAHAVGAEYFLLKEELFKSKEEAIRYHKKGLKLFTSAIIERARVMAEALKEYDLDVSDGYISFFTGEAI